MGMAAYSFDTLGYAKRAKEVGFSEQQAEFQAGALLNLINEKLVTKHDITSAKYELMEHTKQAIAEVKQEIKQEIAEVRQDVDGLKHDVDGLKHDVAEVKHDIAGLRHEIKDSELRLTVKMGTFMAIAVGILAALQKLL